MSDQGELHRILSNPDNLIVSDSIKERIDFSDEEESPEISVVLSFENFDVFGKFLNYEYSKLEEKNCCSVSLACSEDSLVILLNINFQENCILKIKNFEITGPILGISISDSSAELLVNVTLERNTQNWR
jgi:hypothetical protein